MSLAIVYFNNVCLKFPLVTNNKPVLNVHDLVKSLNCLAHKTKRLLYNQNLLRTRPWRLQFPLSLQIELQQETPRTLIKAGTPPNQEAPPQEEAVPIASDASTSHAEGFYPVIDLAGGSESPDTGDAGTSWKADWRAV